MKPCSLKTVRQILREHGLRPSKRLGQNFLINKRALKKIVQAADLSPQDTVLEIGPGLGTITQELAKRARQVIAVEKDLKLCEVLKETLKEFRNVEIVRGDILKHFNRKLKSQKPKLHLKTKNYKVVANLPFYLTANIIRKFLESASPPKEMVLVVQKEVAQRICAQPPHLNLLAIAVKFYAALEVIASIQKNAFWPQPKVDAAILKLKPSPLKPTINQKMFFRILRAGFAQPRKKLVNNLTQKLSVEKEEVLKWLKKCKIEQGVRAENLTLEEWLSLAKTYRRLRKSGR